MDDFFTQYWYLKVYALVILAVVAVVAGMVGQVWWKRRQQWKTVRPHYGSVYDASVRSATHRPNVRLVRP